MSKASTGSRGSAPAGRVSTGSATGRCRVANKILAIILIGSMLGLSASAAPTSGAPAKAAAGDVNPFPSEASTLGVRKCANLFSALGQAAAYGSTFGVATHADQASPDAHAVQAVTGMTYSTPGYSGQAAGIILAAPVGQSCEGQMVRVAPFQKPCKDVVGQLPAGSVPNGVLSGVPLYNLGGNQGQALLVASGASCVVVTVTRAANSP